MPDTTLGKGDLLIPMKVLQERVLIFENWHPEGLSPRIQLYQYWTKTPKNEQQYHKWQKRKETIRESIEQNTPYPSPLQVPKAWSDLGFWTGGKKKLEIFSWIEIFQYWKARLKYLRVTKHLWNLLGTGKEKPKELMWKPVMSKNNVTRLLPSESSPFNQPLHMHYLVESSWHPRSKPDWKGLRVGLWVPVTVPSVPAFWEPLALICTITSHVGNQGADTNRQADR